MKKIIYLLTISLSSLLFGQATQKIGLDVDIRGRDCAGGGGFCGDIGQGAKMGDNENFKVVVSKLTNQSLVLEIDKNMLDEEEQINLTGSKLSQLNSYPDIYILMEEMVFAENLIKDLGINKGYVKVAPGEYPMRFENDKFIITLRLQKL